MMPQNLLDTYLSHIYISCNSYIHANINFSTITGLQNIISVITFSFSKNRKLNDFGFGF